MSASKGLFQQGVGLDIVSPFFSDQPMGEYSGVIGDFDKMWIADTVDDDKPYLFRRQVLHRQIMRCRVAADYFILQEMLQKIFEMFEDFPRRKTGNGLADGMTGKGLGKTAVIIPHQIKNSACPEACAAKAMEVGQVVEGLAETLVAAQIADLSVDGALPFRVVDDLDAAFGKMGVLIHLADPAAADEQIVLQGNRRGIHELSQKRLWRSRTAKVGLFVLHGVKVFIFTFLGEEFFVGSLFDDHAILDDDDP